MNSKLIKSCLVFVALVIILMLGSSVKAQAPDGAHTHPTLEARLSSAEARIAALERAIASPTTIPSPTPSPTPTPTASPTPVPTPPPTANIPKGLFRQYQPSLGSLSLPQNPGIVRVIFNLQAYRNSSTIDSNGISAIGRDLQTIRASNATGAWIRFVYDYTGNTCTPDPTPTIAAAHILQIGSVLNPYADDKTIDAVESGIIGKWGEWHYAGCPGDSGQYGHNWYGSDWSKFMTLAQQELDAWRVPICIRYPRMFIHAIEYSKLRGSERLCSHIDSLLADEGWGGSFPAQGGTSEYQKFATYMKQGRILEGEFENTSLSNAGLCTHLLRMRDLGADSANEGYHPNTIGRMKAQTCSGVNAWTYLQQGLQLP